MIEDPAPRGMILAAGYGTRLAPLTDHLPKPLLPVPGGTVLDRAIAALDRAGVGEIAVNTHHLADRVADHLADRPDRDRFRVSHEPEILGTGGALHGAREFLVAAPCFLLHNGDVLADVDLVDLLAAHRASGALATLVLVDWPEVNSVALAADGSVTGLAGRPAAAGPGDRQLTYAGIGVFDREILADIGPGFSSLIDPLVRALEARPGSVRGHVPADPGWSDLGTLPRWLEAVVDAGPLAAGPVALTPLTGHGSDRRFWRLETGEWSAVVMQSPPTDAEFTRAVNIARYLDELDLGAPAVLDVHPDARVVLWEDIGTGDLQSVSRSGQAEAYRRVVDHLLQLQDRTRDVAGHCPDACDRRLGPENLAWETDYFRERFLQGFLGFDTAEVGPLAGEFAALNRCVADQHLVTIHRDFQSQNIHLQGDRVRLVDVQGMRRGPLGYDLASLVWDPYVEMAPELRDELVERFGAGAADIHGLVPEQVAAAVRTAALQRLMQALGAFGFLGLVKGKTGFLAHIPRGLINLREALRVARGDFALPALEALLDRR